MDVNLVKKYRYPIILLKELVRTDFKLRYQGSALGYLWSLMRPLFLFIIMYIVFVYFLRVGHNVPQWPIQLLLGIVLWNFFAEVTNNGVTAVVNRGDVIRKINFPKYVIILASSISALINLAINLFVIILFMLISGAPLQWQMVIAPIYIIELFTLSLGISFLLSAVFVKLRDVNYIWEIIMQGLFYGSVVIYPITMIIEKGSFYATALLLNPIAQIIQDARHTLVSGEAHTLYGLSDGNLLLTMLPIAITLMVFIVGATVFKKSSPYFAENV